MNLIRRKKLHKIKAKHPSATVPLFFAGVMIMALRKLRLVDGVANLATRFLESDQMLLQKKLLINRPVGELSLSSPILAEMLLEPVRIKKFALPLQMRLTPESDSRSEVRVAVGKNTLWEGVLELIPEGDTESELRMELMSKRGGVASSLSRPTRRVLASFMWDKMRKMKQVFETGEVARAA